LAPTAAPSVSPTRYPTRKPDDPTEAPTMQPSLTPTAKPTLSPTHDCSPGFVRNGAGCIACTIGKYSSVLPSPVESYSFSSRIFKPGRTYSSVPSTKDGLINIAEKGEWIAFQNGQWEMGNLIKRHWAMPGPPGEYPPSGIWQNIGGTGFTPREGTVIYEKSATVCLYCPAGKYSNIEGSADCTTSGIGQYVSAYSTRRFIRIDNIRGGVGGDCNGKIINLGELTLWSNGTALSMPDAPVSMSTIKDVNSNYGSPEKLVDGNIRTFIHTVHIPTCDPDPWMYIDIENRIFDMVVVTNRVDCCRNRINGARISFVSDVNGEVPYAARQFFPSTSAATFTFAFPEGKVSTTDGDDLGGISVSNCAKGFTTSSPGSASADACNVCDEGFVGDGVVCSACGIGYSTSFDESTSVTACIICDAGFAGDGFTCTACGIGKYAAAVGSSVCLYCPAGKYSNEEGAKECTTSGIGKYVSTFSPSPPQQYIRIDNLIGGVGGGCDGVIINLAEIALWRDGVALSMSETPVVMSTRQSGGKPSAFVDGFTATIIHTQYTPCDPNPWVYIDVGNRTFDQVVVTNRVSDSRNMRRINGARISFVGDVNGEVPYATRQFFPSTSAAIAVFTFAFPEGSGALGGTAVSNCTEGYTTSSVGSISAEACNVCDVGYEGGVTIAAAPYIRFQAADYDAESRTWADTSGNVRNLESSALIGSVVSVTQEAGSNGVTKPFTAVSGDFSTKVFIANPKLDKYTFCGVARYSGNVKKRIFTSNSLNWLSGFWRGNTGVAFHDRWMHDRPPDPGPRDDINWHVLCDAGDNFRWDGLQKNTVAGTVTYLPPLCINCHAESSDWQVAEMLIYDRTLSSAEIENVELDLKVKYGISSVASAGPNKIICNACRAGYTTTGTEATSLAACDRCAAGYEGMSVVGTSGCTVCAAGFYKPLAANAACTPCATGYAGTATGSTSEITSCTICAAGYAGVSVAGASGCSPCAAGFYKPVAANAACTACTAGCTGTATGGTSATAACTICTSGLKFAVSLGPVSSRVPPWGTCLNFVHRSAAWLVSRPCESFASSLHIHICAAKILTLFSYHSSLSYTCTSQQMSANMLAQLALRAISALHTHPAAACKLAFTSFATIDAPCR